MEQRERMLVVGATGMFGHVLALAPTRRLETWGTVRGDLPCVLGHARDRILTRVDGDNIRTIDDAIKRVHPITIVNCVGIVKQRDDVDVGTMRRLNAELPHFLAKRCDDIGARLIHLSTDCVFSGAPGNRPHGYTEGTLPDPIDDYGRTKLDGEIERGPHLTLRTSMIGPELKRTSGLFAWFMQASAHVSGYSGAWFTGVGTPTLAALVIEIAESHPSVTGVHHVPAPRISKFDLLCLLRDRFRPSAEVEPVAEPVVDRCLDGRTLAMAMGIETPQWPDMMAALATIYDKEP